MDCESKNPLKYGTLASVPNDVTNEFLVKLTFDPAWIGGNDLVKEGTWVWTDGSPWNYKKWAENEPNNNGDDVRNGWREGDFLMLNGLNKMSFWIDDDGVFAFNREDRNSVAGYICQYDPVKAPTPKPPNGGNLC